MDPEIKEVEAITTENVDGAVNNGAICEPLNDNVDKIHKASERNNKSCLTVVSGDTDTGKESKHVENEVSQCDSMASGSSENSLQNNIDSDDDDMQSSKARQRKKILSAKKKKATIIESSDSESDNDGDIKNNKIHTESDNDDVDLKTLEKNTENELDKSDSDNDSSDDEDEKVFTSRIKKNSFIQSSDSENDNVNGKRKKSQTKKIGEDEILKTIEQKLADDNIVNSKKTENEKSAKIKKKRPVLDSSDSENEDEIGKKLRELAGDESSDEDSDDVRMEGDGGLNNFDPEDIPKSKSKKKNKERPKRFSKTMAMQTTSEQQRLKREQSIQIPYHTPEVKPLADFLKRVPQIKRNSPDERKAANIEPKKAPQTEEKKSNIQKIFECKPRLSLPGGKIDFNIEIDEKAQPKGLDSFMIRFAKHTDVKKKSTVKHIIKSDTKSTDPATPGGIRASILEKLKNEMRKKRQEIHQEMERQTKLYEEESYLEEMEDEELDERDSEDQDESDDEDVDENEKVAEADHETETEEKEEELDDKKSKLKSFATLERVMPVFEVPQLLRNDAQTEKEHFQWEDSSSTMSSIFHAGQGDPTGKRIYNSEVKLTPFSKLLKSGLLDSASKSHHDQSNEMPVLSLPCEDTQDLFRESKDETESTEEPEVSQHFHLALDEDTQFGQVLDSQGFINDKSKKNPQKKLFDDNDLNLGTQISMTQVLGFCSGQFTEANKESENHGKPTDVGEASDENEYSRLDEEHGISDDQDENNRSIKDVFAKMFKGSAVDKELDETRNSDEEENIERDGESEVDNNDVVESEDEENEDVENEEEGEEENEDGDYEENKDEIEDNVGGNEEVNDETTTGKGWQKKLFYEHEAELSGSDVGSDDEELGSEYDEYEIDSEEENLPTGEKLKKQVHRIHQRKMIDQDKREVRLLQELYFEDGDLADGNRRRRNFRWRNSDLDERLVDGERKLSDEENDMPLTEIDINQRMERIERENYIQQLESEKVTVDESSQMILDKIISTDKPSTPNFAEPKVKAHRSLSNTKPQGIKRSGSFIGSQKSSQEIVLNTCAMINSKSGKSFVFQTAEALKTQSRSSKSKASSNSLEEPPTKMTKLSQRSSIPKRSKSIFKLM